MWFGADENLQFIFFCLMCAKSRKDKIMFVLFFPFIFLCFCYFPFFLLFFVVVFHKHVCCVWELGWRDPSRAR